MGTQLIDESIESEIYPKKRDLIDEEEISNTDVSIG